MRFALLSAVLSLTFVPITAWADDSTPKTGTFTTTFADTSPLTSKQERAKRFPRQDFPAYDLSQEPFLVHVPDDYTPATPHGLVVLVNYKDNDTLPPLWPPVLAKHHLIYAMDTHHDHPDGVTAAISVDAVHNLRKSYAIDPNRIYVVGVQGAQTATLFYPDVFTGSLWWGGVGYFRPIPDPKSRGHYPPKLDRPQGPTFALAKTRPYIIGTRPDTDETTATYYSLVLKAFRQDGFSHLQTLEITKDDFHYPNLTTEWFEKAIEFFDASAPTTQPVVSLIGPAPTTNPSSAERTPSTKAAYSEPQRLLALANYCIKNNAYPAARQRLETIVKNYPDDPAAKEAQDLLNIINKQPPTSVEWNVSTHGGKK